MGCAALRNRKRVFPALSSPDTSAVPKLLVPSSTSRDEAEECAVPLVAADEAEHSVDTIPPAASDEVVDFSPCQSELVAILMPEELHPFEKLASEAGGGCCIEQAENRGIRLGGQLHLLQSFIMQNCEKEGWTDRKGVLQKPETINLYCVVEHVVLPATKHRKCSFVELVAQGPQKPDWFVSHWWGEPILSFISCLRKHSQDRQVGPDPTYWVCAYANNQWSVGDDIGSTPEDSSFRRAMKGAKGTLSILDPHATCYTRVWCIYEIFVSVLASSSSGGAEAAGDYLYDIYTVGEERGAPCAIGITDGYIPSDGQDLKCSRRKRHRELHFPWQLSCKALEIELQTAQASREEDRWRILNTIAGSDDLSRPPPETHPNYDLLNHVLRGRFAAGSWVKAAGRQEDLEQHGAALALSRLPRLTLHFGGDCLKVLEDQAVGCLARGLPPTLLHLSLGFNSCTKLTNRSLQALRSGLQRCTLLQRLELQFNGVKAFTDDGAYDILEGISGLVDLQHLHLDLSAAKSLSRGLEVAFAELIPRFQCLTSLHLALGKKPYLRLKGVAAEWDLLQAWAERSAASAAKPAARASDASPAVESGDASPPAE